MCNKCCQVTSLPPRDVSSANVSASLLLPHLQNLFQQTAIQQVKNELPYLFSFLLLVLNFEYKQWLPIDYDLVYKFNFTYLFYIIS